MADNARNELVASLTNLLESGQYSDLIITCNKDTYKVHKAVICARSGFFKRAERFPVGSEATENNINLPEDDPTIIKLLIDYLYTAEYGPKLPDRHATKGMLNPSVIVGVKLSGYHYCLAETCKDSCVGFVCKFCCPDFVLPPAEGDASQLLLHAKMYEIADKYDVVGLKELAREKFLRACAVYWDDEHFAPAAYYAFSTTMDDDMSLRDIVGKVISEHILMLNKPAVLALLHEFHGLAVSILTLRATDLGWIKPA